jgi:hypothetical protein
MRRIRFNTTFEQDEEERRMFFASLNYPERLKYYLKARKFSNFYKLPVPKDGLKICSLDFIPNRLIMNF